MNKAQISRPERSHETLDCQTAQRVVGEARQRVKERLPWWHDAQFQSAVNHIASCQECRRWLINEMP